MCAMFMISLHTLMKNKTNVVAYSFLFLVIVALCVTVFNLSRGNMLAKETNSEVLAAHNRYRAEINVPFLKWNLRLEQMATADAQYMSQLHSLQHNRTNQNLAMGTSGRFTSLDFVNLWAAERRFVTNFDQPFPQVVVPGKSWSSVGHYTAMVWRTTTEIGCGRATDNVNDYFVCIYEPQGNVVGQDVAVIPHKEERSAVSLN